MAGSPHRRSGSRSRSPQRPRKEPKGSSGFRWKEKRPGGNNDEANEERERRDRGYRNRSPPRRREQDRGREDERDRERDLRERDRDFDRARRDRGRDTGREEVPPPPSARAVKGGNEDGGSKDGKERKEKKDKKDKKAGSVSAGGASASFIVVHVNDRLGTKAAIPCLGSDLIKQFKVMVAMRIGREPHEILLKRQGERPFRDELTLDDYGIGNGVQLDLEVDTGD